MQNNCRDIKYWSRSKCSEEIENNQKELLAYQGWKYLHSLWGWSIGIQKTEEVKKYLFRKIQNRESAARIRGRKKGTMESLEI